ncbi:type 1 glutamine amidotransferase [bacterium]|nr:type 1 glutamine amidotransferase [bacterium]
MKPVLFLQNITLEGPSLIGSFLNKRNIPYQVNDLYAGDPVPERPEKYRAVVALGGPMNADDDDKHPYLAGEKKFLRACVDEGVPVLGICLGAQLLARALGARVYKNKTSEIGWLTVDLTEDGLRSPLMKGLDAPLPVFQWHGDTFDLPEGGKRLAGSPDCRNQAFSVGSTAFGLQFHLEVTCNDAADWAKAYLPDVNANDAKHAQRLIEQPEYEKADQTGLNAEKLMNNFLAVSPREL